MDYSLPASSVHEVFQARRLEWGAVSFSRGPSWSRDRTQVSCLGRWFLCDWASRDSHSCLYPTRNITGIRGNWAKGKWWRRCLMGVCLSHPHPNPCSQPTLWFSLAHPGPYDLFFLPSTKDLPSQHVRDQPTRKLFSVLFDFAPTIWLILFELPLSSPPG